MASGKQPITRHPLFPATAALWFGALFGIGSLAVHPALIEAAIVALKLDAIIAVPMGSTTRILIALALAGAGGLLGAKLARRIARPKPIVRARKRGARSPAESFDGPAGYPDTQAATPLEERTNRRSQLAIPDNAHAEVEYYDRAPVPGNAAILEVSKFGIEGFEPETITATRPENVRSDAADAGLAEEADFLPGPAYQDPPETAPITAPNKATTPALPRLSGDEEGYAIAKPAGHAKPLFSRTEAGLVTRPLDDLTPAAAEPAPETQRNHDGEGSAARRIVSAQLDDLAPIELLERLAISLRQKQSQNTTLAEKALTDATLDTSPNPVLDDVAEGLETKLQPSSIAPPIVPPAPTMPAALRPIGLDPDEDDDALPGYIPPRHIGGARHPNSAAASVAPSVETPAVPSRQQSGSIGAGGESIDEQALPAVDVMDEEADDSPKSSANVSSPDETDNAPRSPLGDIQRMRGTA